MILSDIFRISEFQTTGNFHFHFRSPAAISILEVAAPKKTFFPCRELYLIAGNRYFFQSTVFLYFTKVFEANHSLMNKVFSRRALAAANCKYTMYVVCFIRKSFFCLSLNFLNIMTEIRLRFS